MPRRPCGPRCAAARTGPANTCSPSIPTTRSAKASSSGEPHNPLWTGDPAAARRTAPPTDRLSADRPGWQADPMTSPNELIAVTGVTGGLGGRVARRLAAAGLEQRLVVRDAARAPELPGAHVVTAPAFGDFGAMRTALTGARTLL